ncbi:SGNH/GDSL hydrolase family protein [Rhodopirellula bahusiensis]|uniref:Acyl-CoA thioesterase n=1 Tax=Rhodopirellula bahusiensis TaxID=2014065 RepID=A0A2G1W4G2_9BACT|nr:SGNH/GDSL hydrolase family protein [Rhodopirellula bahusiensis]PHQ33913.1 acyl-CoA thioesterase [Rhodopirellula bahusiensis]
MHRPSSTLCCLIFCLFTSHQAHGEFELRDAVECHPRAGLPRFTAKVESGETVRVAYLGGSITAAPGWRIQSRQWLQQQYPAATIEEIHAAIGGTGSGLGVFRLQRDALQHDPDLLFVEFAVNDGGTSPERIHQSMEGIVRQTWAANPNTDICFVYTLTQQMLSDLQSGKMPRAASAMEMLADHYSIPSIHFGVEVARLEAAGKLVFKAPKPADMNAEPMVFSSDGVHPHVETGHRVYTETIARSWPKIIDANQTTQPHSLGKPLRDDNWEQAKMVAIEPEMLSGDWTKLPSDHSLAKRFQRNMPELYQANGPGASLEFTFEGTNAGVFDILGPDGGEVRVQIDGNEFTRNRIDGYCTYHRMATLKVGAELEPGQHTVKIELTPTQLDKREILFERNQADFDAKPEKYQDQTWYASSLMLIGDLK